VFTFRV